MVRLKADRRERLPSVISFQFHYGTIKSLTDATTFPIPEYFNSTMVRLKVRDASTTNLPYIHFNSTMVRLKVSPMQIFFI